MQRQDPPHPLQDDFQVGRHEHPGDRDPERVVDVLLDEVVSG